MSNDSPSKQQQDAARLAAARRGSLAMAESALGDLFGRRASGFSEFDGLAFRRGSLDSTSAVLDAAILDLHRRRMSMAMGVDPFLDNYPAGLDNISSLSGVGLGSAAAGLSPAANVPATTTTENAAGMLTGGNVKETKENSAPSMLDSSKSLLEQQEELERRQKELEQQRQQLMAAMEERRKSMEQMQQKLGQSNSGSGGQSNTTNGNNSSVASMPRHSLLGSFGGTLAGPGGLSTSSLMSLGGIPGFGTPNSQGQSRDELMQQEAFRMAAARRASMGRASLGLGALGRRSSLDLLVGSLDRPDFATRLATQQAAALGRRDSLGFSFSDLLDSPSNRRLIMQQQQPGLQSSQSGLMQQLRQQQAQLQGASSHALIGDSLNEVFEMMPRPLSLAMEADEEWLTPLHCFVRQHCVHVFTASSEDVATPSKGKRRPIHVGQVGIRCPHCHHDIQSSVKARERGSVYFPTSISSIYNATMNLLQRHLHSCTSVPPEIMRRYETLKADDARSGTSKNYWRDSARSLGLVDTPDGIRFSTKSRPPLPARNGSSVKKAPARRATKANFESTSMPTAQTIAQEGTAGLEGPLVRPEDEAYATAFSFHLLCQMLPCVFTEADRLGKRKGLPPGFPGLACRHCFGGFGSGRFFPSSIKTLSDTSKTLNVLHNHMMRCRKCPPEIRELLASTRKSHDEQRAKMKFGSQKAFFARIWDRLHYKDPNVTSKRKFKGHDSSSKRKPKTDQMTEDEATAATAMAQIDGLSGLGLQQQQQQLLQQNQFGNIVNSQQSI